MTRAEYHVSYNFKAKDGSTGFGSIVIAWIGLASRKAMIEWKETILEQIGMDDIVIISFNKLEGLSLDEEQPQDQETLN